MIDLERAKRIHGLMRRIGLEPTQTPEESLAMREEFIARTGLKVQAYAFDDLVLSILERGWNMLRVDPADPYDEDPYEDNPYGVPVLPV